MMKAYISVENIWEDDDIKELKIEVYDGINIFSVNVYEPYDVFQQIEKKLEEFSKQVYGGIAKIELGNFGQEFAYGGFEALFHYAPNGNGKIFISIKMESTYFDFGIKKVGLFAVSRG